MVKQCEIPSQSVADYYAPYLEDTELHKEIIDLYEVSEAACATGWGCESCGHLGFLPVLKHTGRFYKLFNRRKKDPTWRPEYDYARQSVFRLSPGSSVVDFGAGQANFLKSLNKEYQRIAIDPGMQAAPGISKDGIQWLSDIKSVETHLGGKADLVTLFQSLEHIPCPLTLMREIKAMLKVGGSCVVSVPLAHTNMFLFRCSDAIDVPPVHFNYFSKRSATNLFLKAGFKAIESTGVGGWLSEIQSAAYYRFRRSVSERMSKNRKSRSVYGAQRCVLFARAFLGTIRNPIQLGAARTLVIKASA